MGLHNSNLKLIDDRIRESIVENLKEGNAVGVMNAINKIENEKIRNMIISELYKVALDAGTERKEELGSDRFATPRRTDFPKPV